MLPTRTAATLALLATLALGAPAAAQGTDPAPSSGDVTEQGSRDTPVTPPAPNGPPSGGGAAATDLAPGKSPLTAQPLPSVPGVVAIVPTSPPPRAKESPRTPSAEVEDRSSWESWWMYNRESWLDLRRHARATTGGAEAEFLPGTRGAEGSSVAEEALRTDVRPALEHLLEREPSNVIAAEALIALARAGAPEQGLALSERARRLRSFVAHPDAQVCESATLALGVLGESAALRDLLELARDTRAGQELCQRAAVPYRVRAFAAYAVGLVALRAGNEDVRRYAARGLLELSETRALPLDVRVATVGAIGLVALHSDPNTWDADARRTAGTVPAIASSEALVAQLALVVGDVRASALLRTHALTAASRLAQVASGAARNAVEDLCIELLGPSSRAPNELAQSAALALARLSDAGDELRDRAARQALIGAVHQADLDTRHFALLALGEIMARADEDPELPFAATSEIHRVLTRELENGRGAMRSFAALALGLAGRSLREQGRTPSAETRELLLWRLDKATSPEEAGALMLALGLRGESAAADVLVAELVEASDDLTRSSSAVALGLLSAPAALAPLRRQLAAASARPAVLRETAIALALTSDPSLSTDLAAQLDRAPGAGAQLGLLGALAQVGDARSVPTLLAWSADVRRADTVRAAALRALGSVCDARRLPWNEPLTRGANYLAEVETLTARDGRGVLDRR